MHRALALADRLLAFLMRPRVRRVRRWSFVVTLPVAAVVAAVGSPASGGIVLALRFALWLAVAVTAWRLGGARGEAVRDLLMHPRVRALLQTEVDIVLTLPRLACAALHGRPPAPALRYSRGDFRHAIALAMTPPVVVEGAIVHLLVPAGWIAVHVVSAVLHAYALVWLFGWALGSRAYPHRVRRGALTARNGALHVARVPLASVTGATARRERVAGEAGLVVRDGAALLPARGRVDVWLELAAPVAVRRPLGEPIFVTRLAVASDDPAGLVTLALDPSAGRVAERPGALGVVAGLDLCDLAHHALHPA
jgi:hypothetical protein